MIEEVDVKNMHVQTADREERLLTREDAATGVVAVCAGAGTGGSSRASARSVSRAGSP